MPFGDPFSSVQDVLRVQDRGPSERFDGDHPLSGWLAHVTADVEMEAEIEARQLFITAVSQLAVAAERQGYRHATALLLELAANLRCALISDVKPECHSEVGDCRPPYIRVPCGSATSP